MATIALVNPSPRKKGRRKMARKHRTAAQKAATRKLVALNRSRRAGKTTHRRAARRTRRQASHSSVTMHRPRTVRISNPIRHRRRARRRNPMGGFLSGSFWMGEVIPTAVGGVGAIGIDVLIGYLPLPAIVQSSVPVRTVTKIAGALGLGWLAQMATSKKVGEEVAAGAIAVTVYDIVKGFLVNRFPNLPIVPVATIVIPTTTAAAPTGTAGIGWTGAAPQVGAFVSGMGDTEEDYIPSEQHMGSYVNAY